MIMKKDEYLYIYNNNVFFLLKKKLFPNFSCRYSITNVGSSKKSCSKGILESCGLPEAIEIFAMEY